MSPKSSLFISPQQNAISLHHPLPVILPLPLLPHRKRQPLPPDPRQLPQLRPPPRLELCNLGLLLRNRLRDAGQLPRRRPRPLQLVLQAVRRRGELLDLEESCGDAAAREGGRAGYGAGGGGLGGGLAAGAGGEGAAELGEEGGQFGEGVDGVGGEALDGGDWGDWGGHCRGLSGRWWVSWVGGMLFRSVVGGMVVVVDVRVGFQLEDASEASEFKSLSIRQRGVGAFGFLIGDPRRYVRWGWDVGACPFGGITPPPKAQQDEQTAAPKKSKFLSRTPESAHCALLKS